MYAQILRRKKTICLKQPTKKIFQINFVLLFNYFFYMSESPVMGGTPQNYLKYNFTSIFLKIIFVFHTLIF